MTIIVTHTSIHIDGQTQAKSECIKNKGQQLSNPICYLRKTAKPQKPELSEDTFSQN